MKMLQELDISNNPISDITGFLAFTKLESLNISSTMVTDLSYIAGMHIIKLWLYIMPQGMDYTALGTLTYLEDFGSRDLNTEGLRLLSKLESLHSILLFFCEVNSLEPFMNMKELYYLNLHGAQLNNLEGISSFTKLNNLNVTANAINDLHPLIGNTAIEQLTLCDNPVEDFSPLDQMPALKTVTLSRGQETNFTRPISELPFAVQFDH